MVRDKDTGKPLRGVRICCDASGLLPAVRTDQDGKFRLDSLPSESVQNRGFGLPALAIPPEDQPYLVGFQEVTRGPGIEATTVNFELKRGLWVQGSVTDKITGKPVHASLEYQPSPENPSRKDGADFTRFPSLPAEHYRTHRDGTFRIPALPGPGVVIAKGAPADYRAPGTVTINPTRDAETVPCPILLDPGRTLTGRIFGPAGKLLPGVHVFNMNPLHFWTPKPLESADFTLTAVDPREPRTLIFLHPTKHLVKALEVQGDAPSPLTVRLEAAGTVVGRLVDEDGQPRPRVELLIHFVRKDKDYLAEHLPGRITTDREGPDGRFAFTASKAKYQDHATIVSAAAPNYGVGWVGMHKNDKRTDLTLQLVPDDLPITAQIVDLEGKPVPGATLRVLQIMASPKEDLGPWLEATKDKTAPVRDWNTNLEQRYLSRYTTAPSPVATTDVAGRFRLTGIGRNRLVIVQLDGPTIASEHLHILIRLGETFKIPRLEADPEYGTPQIDVTYYGAVFRHVAGTTKPIVGVVRDKDTKEPLAGVTIRSEKLAHNPLHGQHLVQSVTDAQGRYRLIGMPKGAGNKINVVPPSDLPYIAPVLDVPDSFGPDPVTVDVELKRAVWIEGTLTDKLTGKALRGGLIYLVRDHNPNMKDYQGYYGGLPGVGTNEDGTYRIIGLPGPGLLVLWQQPGYLLGAERDDDNGLKEAFGYMPQGNFAAFARIDPAKSSQSVKRDIALVPGWTFTGTVLGPDGERLAGAVMGGTSEGMKSAEFTVRQFNPRRPRPVFFRHPEKGLIGVAHPPRENGGTVRVRMEPGAAITGRLVDADGTPRAGVELRVTFLPKEEPHWNECSLDSVKTDRDGRFHIEALLPGFDYYLNADHSDIRFGSGLRAGEMKDLGDVRIRP
jgi:hypothetical protein